MSGATKNINVTYDFPPIDMSNPTKDWRRFRRDLLGHLSTITDESGSSVAEYVLDTDMGGGAPGAPAIPGGAAGAKLARLRRTRANKAYGELYKYIPDADVRSVLESQFMTDGRGAFVYVETLWDRAITRAELKRLQQAIARAKR